MISPVKVMVTNPPTVAVPGYMRRTGKLAQAEGIFNPMVRWDRSFEGVAGWEALMFHEQTHVVDKHCLKGFLILVAGNIGAALAVVVWWMIFSLPVGILLYVLWRREMEIRADAVALSGAGLRQWNALMLRLEHGKTAWSRWIYCRTFSDRTRRARARCVRRKWTLRN